MKIRNEAAFIATLFTAFTEVRYAAIYQNGLLTSRERSKQPDASSSDTDRYEELLVNPVLLTVARQRGNIDCGGLEYLLVSYGNFCQFLTETESGHLSICLEKGTDVHLFAHQLKEVLQGAEQ